MKFASATWPTPLVVEGGVVTAGRGVQGIPLPPPPPPWWKEAVPPPHDMRLAKDARGKMKSANLKMELLAGEKVMDIDSALAKTLFSYGAR